MQMERTLTMLGAGWGISITCVCFSKRNLASDQLNNAMNMRNSKPADPTRLGTVEDVSGPSVRIKLEGGTETGLVFVRGEGYRVGQVGSFVRIPAGYSDLYGIVSQVGAG